MKRFIPLLCITALICTHTLSAEPLFTYNANTAYPVSISYASLTNDLVDLKKLVATPGISTNTSYISADNMRTRLERTEKRLKQGDPRVGYTVRRKGQLIGYLSLGDGDGFLGVGRGRAHLVYIFHPDMHEHLLSTFRLLLTNASARSKGSTRDDWSLVWEMITDMPGGSTHYGWFPLCDIIASVPVEDEKLRNECCELMKPLPTTSHPSLASRLDLWWDNKHHAVNDSLTSREDGLTTGRDEDNRGKQMLYFSRSVYERPQGIKSLWYSPWGKVVLPIALVAAIIYYSRRS